jgi:hypothetical protein
MKRLARLSPGLILVLLVVLGCSDDDSQRPQSIAACTGSVSVTVSEGLEPTFSWTPNCRLFFLLVEPSDSGDDQWHVISDSANVIAPPVKYGVVPDGAVERNPAVDLVPGHAYHVYLFRWTGPGRQDGQLAGSAEFTR